MSYDKPYSRETITFPAAAFGAATVSRRILGPRGKSGTVRDVRYYPTADAVGTTSVPEITVGSAASTAGGALFTEYARFRLGTSAVAGYAAASGPYRARALAATGPHTGGVPPFLSDFASHVQLETAKIPANTVAVITLVAGVGGSPAGTGTVEVDIDWD